MQGRDIFEGGNIGMLAGGRGVLGVYYILKNIITANLKGGRQQSRGRRFPPLENTLHNMTDVHDCALCLQMPFFAEIEVFNF